MTDIISAVCDIISIVLRACESYLGRRRDATDDVLDATDQLMAEMYRFQSIESMSGFDFHPLWMKFVQEIMNLKAVNARCKHYRNREFCDLVDEYASMCIKMGVNTMPRVQNPDNVFVTYAATEYYYRAGELLTRIRELARCRCGPSRGQYRPAG